MTKHKGGRGNKAPYQSTYVRVPLGVKSYVEKIVSDYRDLVLAGRVDPEADFMQISEFSSDQLIPLQELLPIVADIVRKERSSRRAVARVLKQLYKVDIDPNKL